MICAADGSSEAVGSSSNSNCGRLSERLRERGARLLARGQQSALGVAQTHEIELLEQLIDAGAQRRDAVQQAEEPQVLAHRQIPGERGIDGGEVRALERSRPILRDVDVVDRDAAAGGLEHAEDHVDGRRLARAVRSEEPDDLAGGDGERHPVERSEGAVALAKVDTSAGQCVHRASYASADYASFARDAPRFSAYAAFNFVLVSCRVFQQRSRAP